MTFGQLFTRIKMAFGIVAKGTSFPFDVVASNLNVANRNQLDKPYANSVWVSRAIRKVSGPIASVPLRFTNGSDGPEIADPRLDEFFSEPVNGMMFSDFIEAIVGWISLAGECFLVKDDIWLMNMGNLPFPTVGVTMPKLIMPRPDSMREVVDGGTLVGWELRDERGVKHALLPEQVVQLKNWNPYSDWRGLSLYDAAKCAAEADNFACKFNRNLWQNNGDRGPIVVNEDTTMNDDQRKQMTDALRMKREAGLRGDFRPLFLSGNIRVEDPKVQALDAAAVSTRLQNRHEIALAFGVPPSMFDVISSYSIGSASDRFILIEETCMPMAEKIADKLEDIAGRIIGNDNVKGYFDWDEHSTMQAVRRERLDSALKLWSVGMPMSEINETLRLGLEEYDGWEIGYLPFSVTPSGTDSFSQDDYSEVEPEDEIEDGSDDDDDDEIEINGIRKLLVGRNGNGQDFQSSRPKRERQLWLNHMAKRRKTLKGYESGINRVLMSARSETLQRLNSMGEGKSLEKRAVGSLVFDLAEFKRAMVFTMRNMNRKALDDAGQQVLDEIGADDPWTTPPAEVLHYNRLRENLIVNASEEIFAAVNETIESGIQSGKSIADISDDVRSAFNGISKGRAKRIAMTETGAAYGRGRDVAMKQAGVEFKQWVTSGLGNVRPAHADANGQIVRAGDKFSVGGEYLDHPGDSNNGSAGNVINCHCVSVAVESSEGI